MLSIDVESLSKEECEKYINSIDSLVGNMEGDRVRITVDSVLSDGVPTEINESLSTLNIGLAANGHLFDNDEEGFISYLMNDMYNNRKIMKNSMIESEKNVEAIKHEMKARGIES